MFIIMRVVLIVLLSIFGIMELNSQNIAIDRRPAVAGSFYPADKETLTKDLTVMFADCKKPNIAGNVRAIICPHAGYVFSGKIAASSFSATSRDAAYKNIFIIGSSHIMAFNGASVYDIGDFITPLGRAVVNRTIAGKIKNSNKVFNFPVDAHTREHSIEVQVPFIQYYYKNTPKIIPIIIGTDNTSTIKTIAEALRPYFVPENLFVISSDFSHYPPYNDAIINDSLTAEAIISGDPKNFLSVLKKNAAKNIPGLVTSMCGSTSGLMLLYLAEGNKQLAFQKIDYCNSGDSPHGNKTEVVGYNAIALVEKTSASKSATNSSEEFHFNEKEKEQLFAIARNAINAKLFDKKPYIIDVNKVPEALKQHLGVFVTLKINGVLRGCIGRFQSSSDPLYDLVRASALSSAFEDPRFRPLTKEEYDKVEIEITVLGPLKKINNINEIVLGKHGICIKKDFRSGTMLPQVATEYGWTVEEFLGYTSRDKAGLGWDGWKNADIYIYDGMVLEENKK
jgi:AmmeMemoRadiSam system protein B/AmmeMemoRadiSam system protein A